VSLIKLVDVHKIYRSRRIEYPALRGVNMEVDRGVFALIVGPSGSGKSTLLHIIGGLDRPTKGSVIVDNENITELDDERLSEYRNRKIGFVFQLYNLVPYLTVIENVELPMAIAGIPSSVRREKALQLLEAVGLRDKAFKRSTELSGGEQQRVAIARALANNPNITLADEPTGNLDSSTGLQVVKLFRELVDNYKMTIVMVTHNLAYLKYADVVYHIRDGTIVGVETGGAGR